MVPKLRVVKTTSVSDDEEISFEIVATVMVAVSKSSNVEFDVGVGIVSAVVEIFLKSIIVTKTKWRM